MMMSSLLILLLLYSVTYANAITTYTRVDDDDIMTSYKHVTSDGGYFDRCSLEYYGANNKVDCNWWKITTPSSGEFNIVNNSNLSTICLNNGVESNARKAEYFLQFTNENKDEISTAYLLSPRFTTSNISREFTISLYYSMICNDAELNAYIVPASSLDNILDVAQSPPFWTITTPRWLWTRRNKTIQIPKEFDQFHILLKARITTNQPCRRFTHCFKHNPQNEQAIIAIDDIIVEINNPQCSIIDTSAGSFLDTNFNGLNYNNWIHNGWEIYNKYLLIDGQEYYGYDYSYYGDYKVGDKFEHLFEDGNDGILGMDRGRLYENSTYFKSPLLIANNNCSCSIKFKFSLVLQQPREVIPIHVLQKYGVDEESQYKKQKTLWYNIKPIPQNKWQSVIIDDIQLLDNNIPFIFEFNELRGGSSGVWIFFDDISFHNCDFSLYDG